MTVFDKQSEASARAWLSGDPPPIRTRAGYAGGLLLVGAVTAFVAGCYVTMLVGGAGGAWWWAVHGREIIPHSPFPFVEAFELVLPVLCGVALVLALAKPVLAPKRRRPAALPLDHALHPELFRFVGEVCRAVEAPLPSRIDVNCDVNASVSFREGFASFWGNDLVLTFGLPLAAGLNVRQFAFVLAHEFGHFRQGAGIRASWVAGAFNAWLARLALQPDGWDAAFDRAARIHPFLIVGTMAARFVAWLGKKILLALMAFSQAAWCHLSRRLEYDADRCAAGIAGSDEGVSSLQTIAVLDAASRDAYASLDEMWRVRTMTEDFPGLVVHHAHQMPDQRRRDLVKMLLGQNSGRFDTHPAPRDRYAALDRLALPGVVAFDAPASVLFGDFQDLCRTVSLTHYRRDLGLAVDESRLADARQDLEARREANEARDWLAEYSIGFNSILRPLDIDPDQLVAPADIAATKAALAESRDACASSAAEARELVKEWSTASFRIAGAAAAETMIAAGVTFDPATLNLPPGDTRAVTALLARAKADVERTTELLAPMKAAVERRLSSALNLLFSPEFAANIPDAHIKREEARRLTAAVWKLRGSAARLHEMNTAASAVSKLGENLGPAADPDRVEQAAARRFRTLEKLSNEVRWELTGANYPFDTPRGRITINDYCAPEEIPVHQRDQAFWKARTQLERLPGIYLQCLSRLAVLAREVEALVDATP
jgi:Zn-dependent protease with chaperone function